MEKKIAGYIRVSTEMQVERDSLINQENIITNFALVPCQPCNVVKSMIYFLHNQPGRIGYEEIHCDAYERRTRTA